MHYSYRYRLWKIVKPLLQRVVAIAYEKWSLTRDFKCRVLTSLPQRRSFGSTRNSPQRKAGTRDEPLRTSEGSLLRDVIAYER